MSSQFFQNAQNTQITSGSFVQVQGDQINNTTTIIQAKEKERTELDEYFGVKRGAIYRVRHNGTYKYPRRWDDGDRERWEEGQPRADKTIHAAELVDRPGRMFTVVEYTGPDARKAFEKDLAMLMSELTSNGPQMYGYNLSTIPSILIYNELVPAAQVNSGVAGRMYLTSICWQLHCEEEELWLDPGKGVFCRGLPGPTLRLDSSRFENQLPLTAELIQEDVLLRFLAGLKSKPVDDTVVRGVAFSGASTLVPERVLRPTVISTLTNAPIAVANNTWTSFHGTLSDQKLLADGMARFTLADGDLLRLEWNRNAMRVWMAQAWSVFGARGISLEEDLSVYHLLFPRAILSRHLRYSPARQQSQQPIYLFVRPPPFDLEYDRTSSVHFWSFDEDGQSPLSDDLCLDFGLPMTFWISGSSESYSWSNEVYDSLHQYQLLRGFDPSTTNFARSLGYDENIFHPLRDSDRFAQVNQESPLKDGASTSAAQISVPEYPTTAHPTRQPFVSAISSTQQPSFWSAIFLPPSSEVSGGFNPTAKSLNLDYEEVD
ncbi:hypothetical protein PQX77_021447 [Marasmius sp. AFHP31]|nr:hypothetical protein PQX77_021447 [Marasmius sp. AFHP31]